MKSNALKDSILISALALFCLSPALGQKTTVAVGALSQLLGESETLWRILPKENASFNFPYFLLVPPDVNKDTVLLVVPNNTGTTDDSLAVHETAARTLATEDILGYGLASALRVPLLVPVFPRPKSQWDIYTHALNRKAMCLSEGEMARIDLQLLAMIDDARTRLEGLGISAGPSVFMSGFSASGSFSNRFAFLHPERVKAVASGGVCGICMLPLPQHKGCQLQYPLGISDLETFTGHQFDIQAYLTIPQFIYMGDSDHNDAADARDAYSEEETRIIYKTLGEQMVPTRFKVCESLYQKANINAEFKTYTGLRHEVDYRVFYDVCAFFDKHLVTEESKR